MNFVEAVKEMKQGKKVRRIKAWSDLAYTVIRNGRIESYECKSYLDDPLTLEDFEATDWEIVEETLSDKIIFSKSSCNVIEGFEVVIIEDLKEALKGFIDVLQCDANNTDEDRERVDWIQIKKRAKEMFGGRLI